MLDYGPLVPLPPAPY